MYFVHVSFSQSMLQAYLFIYLFILFNLLEEGTVARGVDPGGGGGGRGAVAPPPHENIGGQTYRFAPPPQ